MMFSSQTLPNNKQNLHSSDPVSKAPAWDRREDPGERSWGCWGQQGESWEMERLCCSGAMVLQRGVTSHRGDPCSGRCEWISSSAFWQLWGRQQQQLETFLAVSPPPPISPPSAGPPAQCAPCSTGGWWNIWCALQQGEGSGRPCPCQHSTSHHLLYISLPTPPPSQPPRAKGAARAGDAAGGGRAGVAVRAMPPPRSLHFWGHERQSARVPRPTTSPPSDGFVPFVPCRAHTISNLWKIKIN